MMIKLIPTAVHGFMDYTMGLLLMIGPWLLNWDQGPQTWVPVVLGATVILYSLVTDYECGLAGLLPMPWHLGLDVGGGAVLAASPWLFGFAEQMWIPHFVLGVLEIVAGLITDPIPTRRPRMTGPRPSGV